MGILSKNAIGVDISDHSIEVIKLEKKNNKINVLSLGRLIIDPGIVERGRIKDKEKLFKAVNKTFASAKPNPIEPKKIIFSLPEDQVYYHFFSAQLESTSHEELIKEEVKQMVLRELKTSIPIEEDEMLFTYKILFREGSKVDVLVIATDKRTVGEWRNFFQELEIDMDFFDFEIIALSRSVLFDTEKKNINIVLVDMGAEITNIAIVNKRGLNYSHSINIGGTVFSKDIAKNLKISIEEAKEKKMKTGLSDKDDKVFLSLTKSLHVIITEIKESLDYFQAQRKEKVGAIILAGGSARLRGLAEYFKEKFDLPVFVGGSKLVKSGIPLKHLTTAGSALRGIDGRWKNDPMIDLEKISASALTQNKDIDSTAEKGEAKNLKSWLYKNKRVLLILLLDILIISVVISGFIFFKK